MTAAPVVDSHHHFWWDPSEDDYPWMSGENTPIRRTYGPDALRPELNACGVDFTVLVQTRSSLEETRRFLDLAVRTHFIAGVVGWVDLTAPGVATTITDLKRGIGGGFLSGIRHQVHDEADPEWLLRPDALHGLESLGEAGLAYDLLVRTRELSSACAVARRFPHIRFAIDHMGKPPIRTAEIDEWASAMAPLSELDNVACKLSGMVTEANWSSWSVDDLLPYVERVVGWFGEDRLMFGSDWPVCLLAAPYSEVFTAYRATVQFLSETARQKIFGKNAIRFYALDVQTPPAAAEPAPEPS